MCGIGAIVTEPKGDHFGGHPGLKEMHRRSVSECMGRNPAAPQRWRCHACFLDPFPQLPRHTRACHLLTKAIRQQCGVGRQTVFMDPAVEPPLSGTPNRNLPLFAPLSMKREIMAIVRDDITRSQSKDLGDAASRVV